MGLELNNFWNFTKSQKISRSAYIIDLIANKIDNNQYIKRFIRYNTINPLSKRSKNYNNETIIQPDLNTSLKNNSNEIKNTKGEIVESNKSLYLRAFNENMTTDKQNYIFIENNHNTYSRDFATMYFRVHILTPSSFLEIEDENSDINIARNKAIACVIDDMLDQYTVDDKYSDLVGNIQFELTDYNEERLSNSNEIIITTLAYKVNTLGCRIDNYR